MTDKQLAKLAELEGKMTPAEHAHLEALTALQASEEAVKLAEEEVAKTTTAAPADPGTSGDSTPAA